MNGMRSRQPVWPIGKNLTDFLNAGKFDIGAQAVAYGAAQKRCMTEVWKIAPDVFLLLFGLDCAC